MVVVKAHHRYRAFAFGRHWDPLKVVVHTDVKGIIVLPLRRPVVFEARSKQRLSIICIVRMEEGGVALYLPEKVVHAKDSEQARITNYVKKIQDVAGKKPVDGS